LPHPASATQARAGHRLDRRMGSNQLTMINYRFMIIKSHVNGWNHDNR
jgi:hypothetical protein